MAVSLDSLSSDTAISLVTIILYPGPAEGHKQVQLLLRVSRSEIVPFKVPAGTCKLAEPR